MPGSPDKTKTRILALVAMIAGLFLPGCQSLEQIAPPVAIVTTQPSAQLTLGRQLYLTKCVKCHAPEPILKYTLSEWTEIVADMAEETNLTPHETAAVRDYVMAVLANAGNPRPASGQGGL